MKNDLQWTNWIDSTTHAHSALLEFDQPLKHSLDIAVRLLLIHLVHIVRGSTEHALQVTRIHWFFFVDVLEKGQQSTHVEKSVDVYSFMMSLFKGPSNF